MFIILPIIILGFTVLRAQEPSSSPGSSDVLFYDTMTGGNSSPGTWDTTSATFSSTATQEKEATQSATTEKTSTEESTTTVTTDTKPADGALVKVVEKTNKILEFYLKQTPSLIRKGIYGSEGLSAIKMKAIEQTLPDPVAAMVKTQQEITAAINPFNPSGQSLGKAALELENKIRDSFAGINLIVTADGSNSTNRYEYTARLLTKLLYPVIKGGKGPGTAGQPATLEGILEQTKTSEQIHTAFVSSTTPEDNITLNIDTGSITGEKESAALKAALSDANFKKAAEVFILLTNLKYRFENCYQSFQKESSGGAMDSASSASTGGPQYVIANEKGLGKDPCKKEDTACINKSLECGPIIEGSFMTIPEAGAAKFANGWAQLITDTESIISEKIAISNPGEITATPDGSNAGFLTCEDSSDIKKTCQSINFTLAKLTKNFQKSLSLKASGSEKSVYQQEYKEDYSDRSILKKIKPHVGNFNDSMKDPLNSLYAYLFLKLEDLLSASKSKANAQPLSTTSPASTEEPDNKSTSSNEVNAGSFPSYAQYIQSETYDTKAEQDTSMLECTNVDELKPDGIKAIQSGNTVSALQFIDSISQLRSKTNLKIDGIPIPLDWQDGNGNKFQIVLAAGAWIPLVKSKDESGNKSLSQFKYEASKSASLYIVGKSADVTETTSSKRPGFYQDFENEIKSKIDKETSAMLGKTTAYSSLLYPYQQRSSMYKFSCTSLSNNTDKKQRTVYMTPIQAMKQSSTWRLKNTNWRNSIATMDTNNLLREMIFLLAEMRQMQFEQYLQMQKGNTLAAAQVASSSAGAAAASGAMGGSDYVSSYVTGRKQDTTPGPAASSANNATESATSAVGNMDTGGTGGASAPASPPAATP